MSIRNTAGAAAIALSLPFTTAVAEENSSPQNCAPENISASVNLNYLQESLNNGKAQFNPLREGVARIDCGNQWSLNLHGDIKTNDAFDYDGARLEKASLTYKPSKDVSIEFGDLGENGYSEIMLASGSGGRPNLTFADTGRLSYANRTETGFGVRLKAATELGEGWKGSLDATVMRALDPEEGLSPVDDRANSEELSHLWTLKASNTNGDVQTSFGLQAAQIQDGFRGDAVETRISPFITAKGPISNNLRWGTAVQTGYFKNSQNQSGNDEWSTAAYGDLHWTPENLDDVTVWAGTGLTFDENINDAWHGEVGVRKDIKFEDGRLSLYGSGGYKQDIAGEDKQGAPAWQVGARFFKEFNF